MTDDERKRQRELFEAWAVEQHYSLERWSDEEYWSGATFTAFRVWQAACEANGVGEPSEVERLRTIQRELKPWVAHNFGDRPSWQPLLGVQEEIGELAHAYLKRAQGIRTNEDHDAAIRDAVADILIFLMDFCNAEDIDLQSEVSATWGRVKQRDWKANTALGTREEPS